eukprot:13660284-Heterocapsa_arctica.AAC.1
MPESCVLKVMAEKNSWDSVETELNNVIMTSGLGKRLFSFAIQHMLSQLVTKRMNIAVSELWKESEITLANIRASKKKILQSLQEGATMELLPSKRDLQVVYRGVPVDLKVCSMAEHFDLLIAAKAKGEAVACGTLQPLFCENDLVVKATNAEAKKGH